MVTLKTIQGRRPRSANGTRRESTVSRFRDLEPVTENRICELTALLGVPRGRVVDEAIRVLRERVLQELAADPSEYCDTIKKSLGGLEPRVYMALVRGDSSPNLVDPKLVELELQLAERRRRRDKLMGRT